MPGFFNPQAYDKNSKGTPKNISQCGKCGLSRKCLSPKMEVYGSGDRKILFIGEAPGIEEDKLGELFVGPSGEMMRAIMEEVGIDLEDCSSTNSITCRPEEDRVEPYMTSCCRPNLLRTIKKIKPKVIIPLGISALESILFDVWKKSVDGISRWVGYTIPLREYDAWVCPTYSPEFVLHKENPILTASFARHIQAALALEDVKPGYLKIEDLEETVEIIRSTKEAKKRMLDLATRSGYLAWDYETTGLKPDRKKQRIVSVSFCLDGKETFACMMNKKLKEPLIQILKNKRLKKIASNMKFEERWSIAKLKTKCLGWWWDTMLAAHMIDNRSKITSVKFQAFVLLGISDYDSHISPYLKASGSNELNRIYELDRDDLLLYNGMDSILEYLVCFKQREIIKNKGKGR